MGIGRFLVAVIVATLLASASVASRQPPQPGQQQNEKPPTPVTGEVVSIDTNARTFSIKTPTAADVEMTFSYSEKTVMVGGEKDSTGLVVKPGAQVTVQYDVHGTANVATRIEVLPKK